MDFENSRVSPFSATKTILNYVKGGNPLIGATLLALLCANLPYVSDFYFQFWEKEIKLQIGDFNLFSHNGHPMTIMEFINDALMAVFFFMIGLEIKREVLVGELSSFKTDEQRNRLHPWSRHSDGYRYCLFAGRPCHARQPCAAFREGVSYDACRR